MISRIVPMLIAVAFSRFRLQACPLPPPPVPQAVPIALGRLYFHLPNATRRMPPTAAAIPRIKYHIVWLVYCPVIASETCSIGAFEA